MDRHQRLMSDLRGSRADSTIGTRSLWRAEYLGTFKLSCDGASVSLDCNGKPRAIIKYLLAQSPRPVSQDYLMGWLWPESNFARARSSLGSAVYTLRKSLCCGEPHEADISGFIVFENGQYSICRDIQISSDVQDFCDLCQCGNRLEETRQTRQAITEYERAIEL
jgi:DNA-binding SARP family transcriptional activator